MALKKPTFSPGGKWGVDLTAYCFINTLFSVQQTHEGAIGLI